ncbi:MAG: HD domain-containing protein [Anaerolineales bacterium]|nr:HD domain-containing protein [Anaerolineales bacterium]
MRAKAPSETELARLGLLLSPAQLELFRRLQPAEQVHALRVFQAIQTESEAPVDLLRAALLHDVGKSRVPLQIWERVLIVLLRRFVPQRARAWGQGVPAGWRRALVVAEQHPAWGAELAAQVGCSQLTVELIRRHQQPTPTGLSPAQARLLARLQVADNDY